MRPASRRVAAGLGSAFALAACLAWPCRRAGAGLARALLRRAGGVVPRDAVTAFERETGIKVAMTRKSSGEIYAQVKAEAANPRGDVWWGGTGDPHLQAAEEGLTVEYKSPKLERIARLGGAPVGAVEEAHRRHLFRRARLRLQHQGAGSEGRPEPKCWADLLDPKLKDDVQVADPNSSGTAYTLLATIVQLMGEEKGFEYLKALHKNINQYTKSGAAPGQGRRPRRDAGRHHVHARHGHDGGAGRAGEGRRALRGHRLRDRLDVDHQGRAQPRQRQEVVRLGADPRRAGARRRRPSQYQVPSNKAAAIAARGAEARRASS